MTSVVQFPRDRGTDSLKSFWRMSNPAQPGIDSIRVEHNEDFGALAIMPPQLSHAAVLSLFIPVDVASYLGFDITSAPVDIVQAPNSSVGPFPRVGPIRVEWVGTLANDQSSDEEGHVREPYLTHAYVWSGRVLIGPALVLKP